MDPITHALASYSLKRAAFPRATRQVTIAIVLAGSITSFDSLSAHISPSAFLTHYRNASDSFFVAVLIAVLLSLPFLLRKSSTNENSLSPQIIFLAILSSALLHPIMDVCQAEPTGLLWPFSSHRFQLDWVAHLDPWIFGILLAALLLPKLVSLVSDEIGAKSKSPRGRVGATVALIAIFLYIGLRAVMHGNAVAALDSRTYRGESPRRTAAYPQLQSPFEWNGIIETESALHSTFLSVGPLPFFDPESATTSYKPESTPALEAARKTPSAQKFLKTARFPKATVEQTPTGYRITLRDFPLHRESFSAPRVQAIIETDPNAKILSEDLAWDYGL